VNSTSALAAKEKPPVSSFPIFQSTLGAQKGGRDVEEVDEF